MSDIIPLGTMVKPWGRVSAVGRLFGERYYWFIDGKGAVAMMPAVVVAAVWPSRSTDIVNNAE